MHVNGCLSLLYFDILIYYSESNNLLLYLLHDFSVLAHVCWQLVFPHGGGSLSRVCSLVKTPCSRFSAKSVIRHGDSGQVIIWMMREVWDIGSNWMSETERGMAVGCGRAAAGCESALMRLLRRLSSHRGDAGAPCSVSLHLTCLSLLILQSNRQW